jgi:arginine/lysine/ornithine decarboxylase
MREEKGGQTPVLVDQAHGAHWRCGLFPPNAVFLGADAVIHSAHKTLACLTQSALLHVRGQRIDRHVLSQSLNMVQSSSPSYLLMASLDGAVEQGDCADLWRDLLAEVQNLCHDLENVYRILGEKDVGKYGIAALDSSKILVNTFPLGISAGAVAEALRREFGIEPELWDEHNILFVLGVGNRPSDVRALARALRTLAERRSWGEDDRVKGPVQSNGSEGLQVHVPPMRLTPREAWLAPRRLLDFRECLGHIAGEDIVPVPPGVPVVVAGEEITEEVMHSVMSNPFLEISSMYVIDG